MCGGHRAGLVVSGDSSRASRVDLHRVCLPPVPGEAASPSHAHMHARACALTYRFNNPYCSNARAYLCSTGTYTPPAVCSSKKQTSQSRPVKTFQSIENIPCPPKDKPAVYSFSFRMPDKDGVTNTGTQVSQRATRAREAEKGRAGAHSKC